jgi:TolB protein
MGNRFYALLACTVVVTIVLVGCGAGAEPTPTSTTPPTEALPTKVPPTAAPTPTKVPPTATPMPTKLPPTEALPTKVPPTATPMPTKLPLTATPTPTEPPPTRPPTAKATPTPEPTLGGKIVFPVFDPERGTYDIFIANADGTGREKIKEEASQPCLGPDGSEITYRAWRADKRGLVIAHTFGEDIWTISTLHEASRPSVSTGGTVFHARQDLESPVHIYLTHADKGAEVIRWGDQHQSIMGEAPAWVSGERLVYKGCEGANCGLYLTDSVYDGTGITQLTYDVTDTNPEASPDGKKVAFMSQRDGNWEVYVMNIDGSGIQRLTNNGDTDGLPIWSPDGQTIAFASDRNGEWAVWAMNPDGSNQRMLFPLEGSLHGYVQTQQEYKGGGWEEERLSWSP